MKILDMPCTKGFMQLAQDGVDKGWHEMNGGNLSYRLTKGRASYSMEPDTFDLAPRAVREDLLAR